MNIPAALTGAPAPAAPKKTTDQTGSAAGFGDSLLAAIAASPGTDTAQGPAGGKAPHKPGNGKTAGTAADQAGGSGVPPQAFPQVPSLLQPSVTAVAAVAAVQTVAAGAAPGAATTAGSLQPGVTPAAAAAQGRVPAALPGTTPAVATSGAGAVSGLAPAQAAAAPASNAQASTAQAAHPAASAASAAAVGPAVALSAPGPVAATGRQPKGPAKEGTVQAALPADKDGAALAAGQGAVPAPGGPSSAVAAPAPAASAALAPAAVTPGAAVVTAAAAPAPQAGPGRAAAEPTVTAVAAKDPGTAAAPQFAQVAAATPAAPATPAQAANPVHTPVAVPAGIAAQIARPVFTMARAPEGTHTLTVQVNPENLGPVTVQAHISAGNVRIELIAANSDGRDVLRQILPDLKRDLAGTGSQATLDLSSGGQPGYQQGAQDREGSARTAQAGYPAARGERPPPAAGHAQPSRPGSYGTDTILDVMA
ncbi:flagellar hook-length control protein FliK [Paenarthrobacter sp. DKR-5]|uniref:flagellar hook-length control protein FliK n=1 Tax=Paenarthrobacter sp. DKR-5 TaxID=2835535 RepID=UPI001BDDB637|nr:flagellar hook-length control protein FliK [Paenarthrobacter sp. DKR-5]MBT1002803.1 flagellar hook-length control protein FliK [Paenarthrobacter sp. DKR-5]